MSFTSLLVFYLGCYGFTTIIVQSLIFKPFRTFLGKHSQLNFLSKLFNCMMCTSFWVGLLTVLILNVSPTLYMLTNTAEMSLFRVVYMLLFDAFSVVGFVWVTYIIQCFIEDNLKREL